MRRGSALLRDVLASGSFDHEETIDLVYDGARRKQDLDVVEGSLRFEENATATIQQSGSLQVIWSDDFGTSLSPRGIDDPLAPFGAVIHLYSTITAEPAFRERVLLGVYEITNAPSAVDEDALFLGQRIIANSVVDIEFKEVMNGIVQDDFDVPYAPSDLTSAWDELSRVSGLPVVRSMPDMQIPRSVVYERSRADAVYDLADVLGGVPHFTPEGALSVRPSAWPAPIDTLTKGDEGTLVQVDGELSQDGVYNRVAIRGRTDDQEVILGIAEVTQGPLRTSNPDGSLSPYRRRTRYYSSEFVTTNGQGQQWAENQLPQVARVAVTLSVREFYNPLRERGDVVRLQRDRELLLGRIASISRTGGAEMDMTVELAVG